MILTGRGIAFERGMNQPTTDLSPLALASEDRSRRPGRSHRLLLAMACTFVFLALCMLFTDCLRLNRAETHAQRPVHQARLVRLAAHHPAKLF